MAKKKLKSEIKKINDNSEFEPVEKKENQINAFDYLKNEVNEKQKIDKAKIFANLSAYEIIKQHTNTLNQSIYNVTGGSEVTKLTKDIANKSLSINTRIIETFKDINEAIKRKLEDYDRQEKELEQYDLYWEMRAEIIELKENILELEKIKKDFTTLYNKLNNIETPKPQPTKKYYSLECEYSSYQIKNILYPLFKEFFECTPDDIINILSENITTQITAKQNINQNAIVYFIDWLKENNYIKAKQYNDVIVKTKCIIWNNKPLTANQLKQSRKLNKKAFLPPKQTENILH